MPTPVYLDHNATTPLDPAVLAAMRPFLEQHFGNPSSGHAYGRCAQEAVAAARLPNTLNASLEGVDGIELLADAPEVAASTGSACHADRTEPSAVLLAMGLSARRAAGAVRLSLGGRTTEADVDLATAALARAGRSRLVFSAR